MLNRLYWIGLSPEQQVCYRFLSEWLFGFCFWIIYSTLSIVNLYIPNLLIIYQKTTLFKTSQISFSMPSLRTQPSANDSFHFKWYLNDRPTVV